MAIEPGDVVSLKSGGQSMTVAAVEESSVECIWMGDNGEMYRETIPGIALTVIESDDDEEDDEDDEEDEDEDEDEDDGDEDDEGDDEEDNNEEEGPKAKRSSARRT